MKIGKQYLALPQKRIFLRQRFFHFHDQVPFVKDLRMALQHDRARAHVLRVRISGTYTRVSFNVDLMPELGKLVNNRRENGDPMLLFFNLFGNANLHEGVPVSGGVPVPVGSPEGALS